MGDEEDEGEYDDRPRRRRRDLGDGPARAAGNPTDEVAITT
jgi:hypothetical protein